MFYYFFLYRIKIRYELKYILCAPEQEYKFDQPFYTRQNWHLCNRYHSFLLASLEYDHLFREGKNNII